MLISDENRQSRIAVCLEAAPAFQLAHGEAIGIVRNQVLVIR
jgi:serine/threonine-protein kinase HipA